MPINGQTQPPQLGACQQGVGQTQTGITVSWPPNTTWYPLGQPVQPQQPEQQEDSFAKWAMEVRMERRRKIILGITWSILIVGVLGLITSGLVGIWTASNRDLPVLGKCVFTALILFVVGIISNIAVYQTRIWEKEWFSSK